MLATRSNIAYCRGEMGDAAGALAAFEALVPDFLRVLGPDDPDTLATRRRLAWWLGEAGDLAGAVDSAERVLADCERILGSDDPDTVIARDNLALLRSRVDS